MAGSWRSGGFHWGGRGGCPGHRRSPRRSPDTSGARQAQRPQQDRAPRSLWCWQILPLAKMHWQSISWNVGPHWKLQERKHRMLTVTTMYCTCIIFIALQRRCIVFLCIWITIKFGSNTLNVIWSRDLEMKKTFPEKVLLAHPYMLYLDCFVFEYENVYLKYSKSESTHQYSSKAAHWKCFYLWNMISSFGVPIPGTSGH